MTVTRGILLPVEKEVSENYDVEKGTGYMVKKTLSIDGTPGEKVVQDGIWAAIKAAGDLPVYVKVKLTWAGKEWPWAAVVSHFDVEYQAVHMAEGSILATVVAVILYALPYVASILLVLLAWKVSTFLILKAEDTGEWMDEYGPVIAVGAGVGVVFLLGLWLLSER